MNVEINIFRGYGPADSALLYAQALDSFRQVNLVVDIAPPIPGYDPFTVQAAPGTVTLWVGTAGDVAPSVAAGLSLEAVGEVTGHDPTVLAAPGKAFPTSLARLAGRTILADTPGAAQSLRAALVAAHVDPATVTIKSPDDPSAPFDPSPLFDGTAAASAVSVYDGWARIEEALAANGEDPATWKERPLATKGQEPLGELVWAQASDLADPTNRSAVAALLGVLAQSQVACANAVEDCAGASAGQSDRTPDGIAWSIDQLDRTIFPSADGIVHIDPAAWTRTISGLRAAGVKGLDKLAFTDDVIDAVTKAMGSSLDLTGAQWKPRNDLKLVP